MRGRCRGVHRSGQRVAQSGSKHGQCYSIPMRPKAQDSDVVIIGTILVCYKSTFILFDLNLHSLICLPIFLLYLMFHVILL